jgi:hypothetical protein
MSLTDEDRARRLAAKRNNERVKLVASTMNTVALTTFGAAFILPLVNGATGPLPVIWIPFAVALHFGAQAVYRFLRSED